MTLPPAKAPARLESFSSGSAVENGPVGAPDGPFIAGARGIAHDACAQSSKSGGFVVESIEMQGFMRYISKSEIALPPGLTVITGRTGSGKTTLLDAITFALYRQTSRTDEGAKIEDICRQGGYVRLRFWQDGRLYDATRGLDRKGKAYIDLKCGGERIAGGIAELDDKLVEIVGLDYTGFRNSTFVRQEEMRQLGAERGSDRLKIVQRLFRLEMYEKARDLAAQRAKERQEEMARLDALAHEKMKDAAKLPDALASLGRAESLLGPAAAKIEKHSKELHEAREALGPLSKSHDSFVAARDRAAHLQKKVEIAEKKERSLRERDKESAQLQKRAAALEEQAGAEGRLLRELENARAELESAKAGLAQAQVLAEKLSSIGAQETQLQAAFREQSQDRARRKTEIQRKIRSLSTGIDSREAFSLLRSEGAVGERIERIELEKEWLAGDGDILARLEIEGRQAREILAQTAEKTKGITAESFSLSTHREALAEIEDEEKAAQKRLEARLQKLAKERQALAHEGLPGAAALEKAAREREAAVKKARKDAEDARAARAERDRIMEKIYRDGDIAKSIEEARREISSLKCEEKENLSALVGLEQNEREYQKTKALLQKMEEEQARLAGHAAALETDLKWWKKEAKRLQDAKAEADALIGEREKASEGFQVAEILAKNVFHATGIVTHAIGQLLPYLEARSSHYLTRLTGGRLSKVKLYTYQEKKEHGIGIDIEGPGGEWRDVAEFSGGERTQINAALRFAIAEELASIVQFRKVKGRMKTLMIDEGDLGSLDTEASRQMFVQNLLSMGRHFDKLILITHLDEVAQMFDSRIHVSMEQNDESRAVVEREGGAPGGNGHQGGTAQEGGQ